MTQSPSAGEVHELLERALAQPREQRAAFLHQACAGRPELRERVEYLVRLAEDDGGFLDRDAVKSNGAAEVRDSAYTAGRTIGAYRLRRPLGRGGMAEVWLAERTEGGFQQQAALKLIPNARGSIGQRFVGERGILASLVHPGIARLYDGGIEPDGSAYMVMEYVEGEHLIAYANAHRLSLIERLSLFLQICDAVAYAQTHLVVHRDLKPSNILVTAEGQAKLLDFGIAKLLDAEPSSDTTRTVYLSPAYAAPEQLTGGAISTATDVYALGVILFELLSGRVPWSDDAAPMATAVKRLLDAPLPPPSKLATERSPVSGRMLRGDLDAIAGKALRREANERYPDARALADDVRRYLDHRPVQARSGARSYVARRFVRRNWLPLVTAASLFVAMVVATVAVAWQANEARMQAQRAEREARTANAVQEFLRDIFRANSSAQSDPVKARQTTARELLDLGAKKIGTMMTDAPEAKLSVLGLLGELYDDLWLKEERTRVNRQALDLTRQTYGPDSPELAMALKDFADAAYMTNDEKEGDSMLREAQAILDRNHDESSLLRGQLSIVQANSYGMTNVPFALDCARRAVRVLGALPPSIDFAIAWYQLGVRQRNSGMPSDGVVSLNRAIDLYRKTEGGKVLLGTAYHELAQAQASVPDFVGAERSARAALDIYLETRGEHSLQAASARTVLGKVLWLSGRLNEGIDLLAAAKRQTLAASDMRKAFHGWALQESGRAQAAAGNLQTGMTDLEAALVIQRGRASKHVALANILSRIAFTAIEMGRYETARQAIDEDAAVRAAVGQARDAESLDWLSSLRVRLALAEHRPLEARQALAQFSASDDTLQHQALRTITRWLLDAELDVQSGDLDVAMRSIAKANAEIRRSGQAAYLKEYSATADLLEGMARLAGGDAANALPLLEKSLAARKEMLLPISPRIAEAQIALAECRLALGGVAQAQELAAEAQAIQAQHEELGEQYREPLRQLSQRLSARARIAKR